ncbi:hypothetical protein GUITHDRAFT_100617 [Guillardia theta CCMP2712]|uniref:Uncharacterized protein n=1 Tax=Guillardia theta (strain CCMP2712) TaxID=905079 RepID=L1JZT3_GUITC|nr:hypothetical protein GUITHDRAFT_100617 [Guillardia theta CCMP2712]EKX53633.1 hypothetical protein GUITHDRAFT_100617 [Guillardia theta CCMP2712]|eukprot:XP_005840613.1 hypothetical protein GUITHDRAFT_100617 [Guillardia theta CCMP2712]
MSTSQRVRVAFLIAASLMKFPQTWSRATEPWVEILSPQPAQLFVEGQFSSIMLHFVVHGVELGADSVAAHVFVIRNAISYGGDAFRGREELRSSPHHVVLEQETKLQLDHQWLDLGLHQVRVHLVDMKQGREIAESACFFEVRLPVEQEEKENKVPAEIMTDAFEDKVVERWDQTMGESAEEVLARYSMLHHDILHGKVPEEQRRYLVLNQQAGGLGNRLGSILSGLLFAILSNRAMLVYWDVSSYLQNGDVEHGGIRWNFKDEEEIKEVIGNAALEGIHYTDMGELSEYLVCGRYDTSDDASADVSTMTTIRITNPHYYIPLIMSNPFYRRRLLSVFGGKPAHVLFNYLFKLVPYLKEKVDAAKSAWKGKQMIGAELGDGMEFEDDEDVVARSANQTSSILREDNARRRPG